MNSLMIALASGCQPISEYSEKQTKFAVCYHHPVDATLLSDDHELLVLEGRYPLPLDTLRTNRTLLGYVSLAEIRHDQIPDDLAPELVATHNQHWNSAIMDIRDTRWQHYVINTLAADALDKGFDGLMLDTIDSALHLETLDPVRYAGMKSAAIQIIRDIRHRYPNAKLMLNRGFELYPEIGDSIDMTLAESIYSNYDLASGKAKPFSYDVYQHYIEKIMQLKQRHPNVTVYSLDYWDMNDINGVKRIYQIQREHGLVPYVATPDLKTIYLEPMASMIDPSNRWIAEGQFYA